MTRLDCKVHCRRLLASLGLLERARNRGLSSGALFDSTEMLLRNLVAVLLPITTHSYAPTAPAAVRITLLRRYGSVRAPAATIPRDAAA